MHLSDSDLQQLNEQKLMALPAKQKDDLLVKLFWDLKEARERLKADSKTSSRPPRSDPPWQGTGSGDEESEASEDADGTADLDAAGCGAVSTAMNAAPNNVAIATAEKTPPSAEEGKRKKAGRRPGALGYSRQVTLPVSNTVIPRVRQIADKLLNFKALNVSLQNT